MMALSSRGCGRPCSRAGAIGLPLDRDLVFAAGPFSLCIRATVLASESRPATAGFLRRKQNHASTPAISAPAIRHAIATPATAPPLSPLLRSSEGIVVAVTAADEVDNGDALSEVSVVRFSAFPVEVPVLPVLVVLPVVTVDEDTVFEETDATLTVCRSPSAPFAPIVQYAIRSGSPSRFRNPATPVVAAGSCLIAVVHAVAAGRIVCQAESSNSPFWFRLSLYHSIC